MRNQNEIDSIKESVDLAPFIQACGIELKKSGNSYKGYCPFHEDKKSPSLSVTPSKRLWQCFGCGRGGDVIDFAREFDGTDFNTTIGKLKSYIPANNSKTTTSSTKKPVKISIPLDGEENDTALTPAHYKLLQRVVDFYHTAFSEDTRASYCLHDRGITSKNIFSDHKIGFANGTLLNVLPDDGETIIRLKDLGILNSRGKEHFYGCATFPLYDVNNNPVGMYGRRVEGMGNTAHHLYLPGERRGIFNRQGARNTVVHLTESILDCLTLINEGIKNTIPCYGTNGLTSDILHHLKEKQISTVYISFDADEAGDTGAAKVKTKLEQEGITAYRVKLPDGQDLNSFFHPETKVHTNPKEAYDELILKAAGIQPAPPKTVDPSPAYQPTEDGFTLTLADRHYEVKGIYKKQNKLKATVKGINKNRFHVDTVDFYSARSRAYLLRGLADLFGKEEKTINRDLEQLLEYTENYQPPESTEEETVISDKDREAALSFLKNPDILEEIVHDLETIGYTGEEMNKLLCYLATVSRKMSDPLSVMIQSRSAAGKSCLQDTILSLVPEEDAIKYTRLTDQALFYKEAGSLAHKILAIEELDGMNGAIYSIRTIQSSKKITVAYTGKDPVTDEMKTGENTVEGPLMVFITTTQVDIDGETASRFVFLSIDESQEMTEKILIKQRNSHTMEGMLGKLKAKKIINKHLAAQRLLQPIRIINPYADPQL